MENEFTIKATFKLKQHNWFKNPYGINDDNNIELLRMKFWNISHELININNLIMAKFAFSVKLKTTKFIHLMRMKNETKKLSTILIIGIKLFFFDSK